MTPRRQAVFFVNLWPEPRSSAAGLRTCELGLFLQRLGYELVGIAPGTASAHSEAWAKSGVRILSCDPNSSQEAEILKEFCPELVLYDRFYTEEKYGWRAREIWPESLQMIDTIDLHCLRGARQRAHRAGSQALEPQDEFFGDDLLREMAALHRADVCLVVSSYEAEWLARQSLEEERIAYLPFSAKADVGLKPQSDRRDFCFLGNYLHQPNADAVRWLESELWPALRAHLPDARLHLYGAYPPQWISQLHGKKGIIVHGFVEDHRDALSRHQILLAPLRFGAGIKGKVLEAWATGTPVLGTPVAFESMGVGFAEFTDSTEFVAQVLEIQKPDCWNRNVEMGIKVLKAHFDEEALFQVFAEFLNTSKSNLPRLRKSLTGRLLRHHGAQSLKYFSQWIEEKNKNRKEEIQL